MLTRLKYLLLLVLLALPLAGCHHDDDWDRPEVDFTSPGHNETGVATTTEIRVIFSERMRAGSIDRTSFYVSRARDNALVEGAIRLEPDDRTAIYTPIRPLDPGERYEVTVKDHVQSRRYSQSMKDSVGWSFTTATTFQSGWGGLPGDLRLALLTAQFEAAVDAAEFRGATMSDAELVRCAVSMSTEMIADLPADLPAETREEVACALAVHLLGDEFVDGLHDMPGNIEGRMKSIFGGPVFE